VVMKPAGLGPENNWAGEDPQQLYTTVRKDVTVIHQTKPVYSHTRTLRDNVFVGFFGGKVLHAEMASMYRLPIDVFLCQKIKYFSSA
jgi:hypothetical protein